MDPTVALELEAKLWKLSDDFGRKQATWLPYWNNQDYVTASPDGVYVSLYHHSENGILTVVSNLSRQEATVEVQFHSDQLSWITGELSAVDALTGDQIATTDGKLQLSLPSLGWKLIWLKPV